MRGIKCHRPMKHATESGLGPVCAKAAKPIPVHDRDLFGYSIAQGCEAATARVRVQVEIRAVEALMDLRQAFNAARRRLGVWS